MPTQTITKELKSKMPLAKVLRSGQITLPKEVRQSLKIKEGDLIDFEIKGTSVIMRPKELIDKRDLEALRRGFDTLQNAFQQGTKDMTETEVEALISEAVKSAKGINLKTAKKTKRL